MKRILPFLILALLAPLARAQVFSSAQVVQWTTQAPQQNPPAGSVYMWFDQTTGLLQCKNSTGTSVCPGGTGVTVSGAVTNGHCASFVSSTQIQDAGAACGSGGGGVSITGSPLNNQIAIISSSTVLKTLVGLTVDGSANLTANSFITGASGVGGFEGTIGSASAPGGCSSQSTIFPGGDVSGNPYVSINCAAPIQLLFRNGVLPTDVSGVFATGQIPDIGSVYGYGYTGSPLSQFAATTSAQLAGVISDETGTGLVVFNTSPSFVTPSLGAATATTMNITTGIASHSVLVLNGTQIASGGLSDNGTVSASEPITSTQTVGVGLNIIGTIPGATGIASEVTSTFSASGNNQTMIGYKILPTFADSANTGTVAIGEQIDAANFAFTGTAPLTAYGLYVTAPTLGTGTNYAINALGTSLFATLNLTNALGVAYGGSGLATLPAHGLLMGEGTSSLANITAPSANGLYQVVYNVTGGVALDATAALGGVPTNAQTGTTYTYLYSDRASYVSFSNASAIAVTLPQANSTGFTANWVNVSCDIGAGTATITPTTSTISYTTGTAYTSGASTLALTTGQCAWIYSDNTNYFAIVRSGATTPAFPITVTGGVSGAIPYFSSTTAESVSALLAANAIVVGGGAGTAPATKSYADVTPTDYVAGGGTAQAQTVTLAPAATALTTGLVVYWLPIAANTAAAPTLAVNGLTAKAITKFGSIALVANDLTTTTIAQAIYDGTEFQLLNPQAQLPLCNACTNAGAYAYGAGTINTAISGTVGWQGPVSSPTTAGFLSLPVAGVPLINNQQLVVAAQSSGTSTTTYINAERSALLTSAYTNATTSFSSVTGMSFAVDASTSYRMDCTIVFSASVSTAGPKVQITGPASPTNLVISLDGGTGAAAFADATATAFSSPITAFGTAGATATNFVLHLYMGLENGVNAGTVQVQAAANGTGTLTIVRDSGCHLQ